MRLLDTKTGQFVDKDPTKTKYAILSHTWDKEGEQTYEQLKKIQQRYPPEFLDAPQSLPSDPNGGVLSSPQQDHGNPPATPRPLQAPHDSPPATAPLQSISSSPDRGRSEPSPVLHPSQHPRNSPSATTSLMESSKPSKSWFAQRMGRFKKWCQRRSIRNAHQSQTNSDAVTITPAVHPPALNDPSALLVNDPPALLPTEPPTQPTNDPHGIASSSLPLPSQERQAMQPPPSIWKDHELSAKIKEACRVARENGYDYIWIDSCCIDKSSSSELSEAINSMYQWYGLAAMCYAYLAGVPPKDDHHANRSPFRRSQWFRRGWTLQELIAPSRVEFLSEDWSPIGSKHDLVNLVESITKIHSKALLRLEPLDVFSVAQRLSWAADRETTRKEDRAYSLLGIFDINMPTLYGEGERAFRRLQEQIMLRIPDQSLFAWGTIRLPDSQLPPDATRTQSPHTFQAETRDLRPRSPPAQLLYNFKDSSHTSFNQKG